MAYRYGNSGASQRGPVREPSIVSLMTALLVAFAVLTLLVLFSGALPWSPTPIPVGNDTYKQYVTSDRELLDSYGYTLEGRVHMPIERAMELTVERGLPVRADAPAAP